MEEQKIKRIIDYKAENIIPIEELTKHPNKYQITAIQISKDTIYNPQNGLEVIWLKTDYEHPLNIESGIFGGVVLSINEEYYNDHKEQIDNLIKIICKETTQEKISIYEIDFINDELIDILSQNNNLKEIELTSEYSNDKNKKYSLKKKDYDKFKNSTTSKKVITPQVESELENIFDPIIRYNMKKKMILNTSYENLQNASSPLYLDKNLSLEEINNLKYLPSNKKIDLGMKDYQNIELILNRLLELDKNLEITIGIENKEIFNKTNIYKNSSKYSKLNILIDDKKNNMTNNLQKYKEFEEILYLFIKPALDKNYSPFEKYIYAYNITKKFKEYKENKQNKTESRDLYEILINEYMVCVGYSSMFTDLLSKLGIQSQYKSVIVTTNSSGQNITSEEGKLETGGHARAYTSIQDEKYGIDGFYIADPTWDNDLENDYYTFLALTNQEFNYNYRAIFQNDEDMLFDSISKEDFFIRLERMIEKKLSFKIEILKNNKYNKDKTIDYKSEITSIYIDIIRTSLNTIKKLDNEEYKKINEKFYISNSIYDSKIDEFMKQVPEIIEYLASYIISKVNKPINGKTIIDAAMVINQDVFNFTEEQANEYRNHLIEINKKKYEKAFPQVTVENHKTGEITYENTQNKFDIDENMAIHHKK